MIRPYNMHYIDAETLSCEKLKTWVWPAVFVWSPFEELPAANLAGCRQLLPAQLNMADGRPIFNVAPLLNHEEAGPPGGVP